MLALLCPLLLPYFARLYAKVHMLSSQRRRWKRENVVESSENLLQNSGT